MRIAVFGLGYVGAVSAACLSRDGHAVVGVDPQQSKVDLVNAGCSPIVEKDVNGLIADAAARGRLRATTDAAAAIEASELSFICVGTPSRKNGDLETGAVENVAREIGAALRSAPRPHCVVLRSTVLPGTMRGLVVPAIERASGLRAGEGFQVANNPEFLREGSSVEDYDHPPKTVIGADDPRAADIVAALYEKIGAPLFKTSIETAELVKYADNAWHAVKVAFANEIGSISKAAGVDSHGVMDIFCADRKLNISPAYLKPGFAFGGSCLPKDLRALIYRGKTLDVDTPLLSATIASNRRQIERAFDMIAEDGRRRVAFLGISFKADTDDLRESPQVALVEQLLGKGYDVRIYDKNVHLARLTGSNRDYINGVIPHIAEIIDADLRRVVDFGDVVVVANRAREFAAVPAMLTSGQRLVDLVRLALPENFKGRYEGVNW